MTSGMLTGRQPAISDARRPGQAGRGFHEDSIRPEPRSRSRSPRTVPSPRSMSSAYKADLLQGPVGSVSSGGYRRRNAGHHAVRDTPRCGPSWRAKVIKDADYKIISEKKRASKSARPGHQATPPPEVEPSRVCLAVNLVTPTYSSSGFCCSWISAHARRRSMREWPLTTRESSCRSQRSSVAVGDPL